MNIEKLQEWMKIDTCIKEIEGSPMSHFHVEAEINVNSKRPESIIVTAYFNSFNVNEEHNVAFNGLNDEITTEVLTSKRYAVSSMEILFWDEHTQDWEDYTAVCKLGGPFTIYEAIQSLIEEKINN